MTKTIVLQSYKHPITESWLDTCIRSVKIWSDINKFSYQFIDDSLFNYVSEGVLKKTIHQKIIATDLARLMLLQDYLSKGYETVIWCDVDFLIFTPEKFLLPSSSYSLGREVWIQDDKKEDKKLTSRIKIHNAFMMFRKNNTFLDFYTETAEKLLLLNKGSMPPQYIGPKLLTAIHNIAQCPVMETAGMLSPLVISDIVKGGGPALTLFKNKSSHDIYAANLCHSLYKEGKVTEHTINQCINTLLHT